MKKRSELHAQTHGPGMFFIILYINLVFFFHEENNFQIKSKADTEARMILEQSVTQRTWE